MYENYWGLSSAPFANRLDEAGFYESPVHEEALARLYFCVEQAKAFAVLHGPAGCGKSQLLQVLAKQIRRTQRFLVTGHLAGLDEADFLRHLENELRLGGTAADSLGSRWLRLRDFLQVTSESGLQTVILLDGFEEAQDSAVHALRRLVEVGYQARVPLTVIAGLNHGSYSPAMKRLFEVADMGIDLRPLERDETESYVQSRLETAGGDRPVFRPDAIDQLQRLTGGVPREINRLCDLALLAGMSESRQTIDRELIAALGDETDLPGRPGLSEVV